MTYEEAALLPRSEKIILITCEASKLVKLFEPHSTNVYVKDVPHFVSGLKIGAPGRADQAESIADLGPTKPWFYDVDNKKLYVSQPVDPKTLNITVIYKFFFSNTPVILPHDLSSGSDVEWIPIVQSIGPIGQQLDEENTGLVLESQSQIDFINSSGYFDEIFDTLIWENQDVKFYSWFGNIPLSEAKFIFSGVVESKDYQINKVVFRVKDFVHKLKNKVKLNTFSINDGTVPDSFLGKSKRRIYGKADKVKCVPIDATLNGFALTGTISIAANSNVVTGTGQVFRLEVTPGDKILFYKDGKEFVADVDQVTLGVTPSGDQLIITETFDESFTNVTAIVQPVVPYRFKNRRWHLAGHRIRRSSAKIVDIVSSGVFVVNDASEFNPGDNVTINNEVNTVRRISGNQIVLESYIGTLPQINDIIYREAIGFVYNKLERYVFNRDFTLDQSGNEAIVEFNANAEFNVAKEYFTPFKFVFQGGSNEVTSQGNIDIRNIVKKRDFIKDHNQTDPRWFEVLDVLEDKLYLREPYPLGNENDHILIKNLDVINDDTIILADCYGKDSGDETQQGTWIKTASDAVYDLVSIDGEFANINIDSFNQANADCDYTLSLVIPDDAGGESPTIRDTITKINESVFGSLYVNPDQEICFSILNTRRDPDTLTIQDDDIISWSVQTRQEILNEVQVNYRHFVDNITGDNSFKTVRFVSDFVNVNVGTKLLKERSVYLYNDSEAETIAQRIAFYNSLSYSIISIRAKANFLRSSVNDRVYLKLDRLYNRYSGVDRNKVGIISGTKKNTYDTEIIVNDLGNVFNRCSVIAPNGSPAFTNANYDEKINTGFILDNDTLTPDEDSEELLGSNLIG